jgi:hypothetical protein
MAATSDWNFTNTDHGLLVAFGEFLRQHGLLEQLMHVPIPQKKVTHTPQAKLIEFLAGIFGGIESLSDLNDGPHPLAKDEIVAPAWGVPRFAHYSGVSRTLEVCDDETVAAIQRAIEVFSQPFIRTAVDALWRAGKPIIYDLDLTGQAVSATSTTYPDTAFGWMDDQVQLGYQLARVCLSTVTGERLWLSGFHHSGDTVSMSCLQELVRAAESQTHVRPRRRTELVQQRIRTTEQWMERPRRLLAQQPAKRTRLQKTELRVRLQIAQVEQGQKSPVFTALSARLGKRVPSWQARLSRLTKQIAECERAITHHQVYLHQLVARVTRLKDWLCHLEEDNQTNPDPPICEVRMDSGFSGGEGLTGLIEMGYPVNTQAPSDKTTTALRRTLSAETLWTRVGANAEMTSPREYHLHDCPYP